MPEKNSTESVRGLISSTQSLGAVDGPGIRFVVFMQGCPLRCVYCHNPETWDVKGGYEVTADEILKKALRYKGYFGEDGGITISGGEALLQIEFVTEVFRLCKENNINTALDTSGIGWSDRVKFDRLLEYTDLVICDIKFTTEQEYKDYTGGSLKKVIEFLDILGEQNIKLWVRQVIVPGINDNKEAVKQLKELTGRYDNVEKIELLPFKKLCISKYENMKLEFKLRDTPETSDKKIKELYEFME
ncbi:MAG: pyruvate formate-lyase-activating protein [Proteocatella sp.]